jgi:hypothetical protein
VHKRAAWAAHGVMRLERICRRVCVDGRAGRGPCTGDCLYSTIVLSVDGYLCEAAVFVLLMARC